MTANASARKAICIYCGGPVGRVKKGEHVIPDALGGSVKLKTVCNRCNNAMSDIDKELVWESPIRLVSWEVLGNHSNDILEFNARRNLALEARVLPGYVSPVLWPQVVFEPKAPGFFADLNEMKAVGPERYCRVFYAYLMQARRTLQDGSKRPQWLWHRRHKSPRRGLYPPRVFTRHTWDEFNDGMHFECWYVGSLDKNELLYKLDNWRPFEEKTYIQENWGVIDPESFLSYRPRLILRALVKIGINLLAHLCQKTIIGKATFPKATSYARYDNVNGPDEGAYGFVINDEIQTLGCPAKAHKFRLTYDSSWWHMACSFFGGRIGAVVAFPGRNDEAWRRADIVVPLNSGDWTVTTSPIIVPTRFHAEWADTSRIIPSVPLVNLTVEVMHELTRTRKSTEWR
jgi:hypothetical protein